MTPLALRTSGFANGVAALHGDTSRRMWRGLWPSLPIDEVPIGSVTNGIHTPSWLSREMHELLDRYIGPGMRERPEDPTVWERAEAIPAGELWRVHELRRERLVLFARERLQIAARPPGLAPHRLARGRRRPAPRCADDLLRAPLRDLQARQPALPRPGPARPPARRREAPGADDRGRQGPPPRRARQGGAAHRRAGVAAPAPARQDRVPRGLRHARRPLPGAGRRRVAERPAPARSRPRAPAA